MTDRIEDVAAWVVALLGIGVGALAVDVGVLTGHARPAVGWAWGGAVAVGGWALLGLAWLGLRALTARRNARALARAWEHVEPEWSGRTA